MHSSALPFILWGPNLQHLVVVVGTRVYIGMRFIIVVNDPPLTSLLKKHGSFSSGQSGLGVVLPQAERGMRR